jgi:hypothetical protein
MESHNDEVPKLVIQAYQRLVRLNLELHKPAVEKWLHSEDSNPELKEMLLNLPCLGQIH